MNAPGIVTTGRENKVVQQFTAATAPRAVEHGSGAAAIDGVMWHTPGASNNAFPDGWTISGSGANISNIVKNSSGDITSYMEGGITKTISYNIDGTVNTVTGGGFTLTVQYSGGEVSGVIYS